MNLIWLWKGILWTELNWVKVRLEIIINCYFWVYPLGSFIKLNGWWCCAKPWYECDEMEHQHEFDADDSIVKYDAKTVQTSINCVVIGIAKVQRNKINWRKLKKIEWMNCSFHWHKNWSQIKMIKLMELMMKKP